MGGGGWGFFTWRGAGVVTSTFEIKGQTQEDLTKAICFDAFYYYFLFISSAVCNPVTKGVQFVILTVLHNPDPDPQQAGVETHKQSCEVTRSYQNVCTRVE